MPSLCHACIGSRVTVVDSTKVGGTIPMLTYKVYDVHGFFCWCTAYYNVKVRNSNCRICNASISELTSDYHYDVCVN